MFLTIEPILSLPIQPNRVVSLTTIVGNMIFHYTMCKQCNPSVLSVNMIDCGLSQKKTDTWAKVFFPPSFKQSAAHRGCHRKWWLMCSHWVIPHHRLMKEESIIHTAVADVVRTAIQVSGNDLLSFSPIVPEKAWQLWRKALEWRAAGGKPNKSLFGTDCELEPAAYYSWLQYDFLNLSETLWTV